MSVGSRSAWLSAEGVKYGFFSATLSELFSSLSVAERNGTLAPRRMVSVFEDEGVGATDDLLIFTSSGTKLGQGVRVPELYMVRVAATLSVVSGFPHGDLMGLTQSLIRPFHLKMYGAMLVELPWFSGLPVYRRHSRVCCAVWDFARAFCNLESWGCQGCS